MAERPAEGWYLMNTEELEVELARHRGADLPPSSAVPLSIDDALAYRNRGNMPDARGRTLRLVLHVRDRAELTNLWQKRLLFEPDHHERPTWRGPSSRPVHVVPLRIAELPPADEGAWWEQPELAELEREWASAGTVAGIRVSEERRGFVLKTVLAFRAAQLAITPTTIANSVERWLPERDALELRAELARLNPGPDQADSTRGITTS